MAKHRQIDLRGVDKNSPEYWEEVLARKGLSMSKGNTGEIVYVGDSAVLDRIAGERELGVVPRNLLPE